MMFTEKVGGSESEDQSFFCAMVAFSKLSVMVPVAAAANQLFAAPAPFAAAPQARRQRTLSSPMRSIYCGIEFFSRQREYILDRPANRLAGAPKY